LAATLALGGGSSYAAAPPAAQQTPVVLLHGLARSAASMETLERALQRQGYRVCNIGYPSRQHSIEVLAHDYVAPAVIECIGASDQPVHFVTHSMGGILVRQLVATGAVTGVHRVVMLGPPNGGSELIDQMGGLGIFTAVGGPASAELGTLPQSAPRLLGPAAFELGIIAGTRSVNPLLSLRIPGEDDGKVSVASARLEGAADFLTVAVSHPFLMLDGQTIKQTAHFLAHGSFAHETSAQGLRRASPARKVSTR